MVLWQEDEDFGENVARSCCSLYSSIGKKGKPQKGKEWTLLAAVVMVKQRGDGYSTEIVSMGTGSKCIGQSKMSDKGDILNDSHAEVIARRGFLRYLYKELEDMYKEKHGTIFDYQEDSNLCQLKDGISFHLFTSHTPCGDASIFPKLDNELKQTNKSNDTNEVGSKNLLQNKRKNDTMDEAVRELKKRCLSSNTIFSGGYCKESQCQDTQAITTCNDALNPLGTDDCCLTTNKTPTCLPQKDCQLIVIRNCNGREIMKKEMRKTSMCVPSSVVDGTSLEHDSKTDSIMQEQSDVVKDIFRTGAKCVAGEPQDPLQPGIDYHHIGVLRTKPGRGDPTLSMSCSDKILKWNVLGCQGGLLAHFLVTPIYLSSVILGRCPYDGGALKRGLYDRARDKIDSFKLFSGYKINAPKFFTTDVIFKDGKQSVEDEMGRNIKISPSSAAIVWVKESPIYEVGVNGLRQGITKSALNTRKARLSICKVHLFEEFRDLVNIIPDEKVPATLRSADLKTYSQFKNAATNYYKMRTQFLHVFPAWSLKPENLVQFSSQ